MAFDFATAQPAEAAAPLAVEQPSTGFDFATATPEVQAGTPFEPKEAPIPTTGAEIGTEAEGAFAKEKQRREGVRQQIGAEVDFEGSVEELGAGIRSDLSLSNKLAEKEAKLNTYNGFENAQLRQTEDGELFIRKNVNSPFVPFDPEGAGNLAEFIKDVADQTGLGVQIVTEIAATRGKGFLTRMLTAGLGGAAAELGISAQETARGFEQDPFSEVFTGAVGTGAQAAGFQGVGELATRAISAATGKGAIRQTPEQLETTAAFRAAGERPTLGQVVESPLFAQGESFAGRLASGPKKRRESQRAAANSVLDAIVTRLGGKSRLEAGRELQGIAKVQMQRFKDVESKELDEILLNSRKVKTAEGGNALIEGLREYKRVSREKKDALYEEWSKIAKETGDEISFTLPNASKAATDINKKVLGVTEAGELRSAEAEFSSQFKSLLNDVQEFSKNPQNMEVLKALRTRASDIAVHDATKAATREQAMAGRLRESLSKDLDESFSSENVQLLESFKRASDAHKVRSEILSKKAMKQIAREESPERLVTEFVQPNNVTNLRLLKENMPLGKWVQFQDSAVTWLARNPEGLNRALKTFDNDTLSTLLGDRTRKELQKFADKAEGLANSPLANIIKESFESSRVVRLQPDKAEGFINQVGGKESRGGKLMRSGLISDMLTASRKDGAVKGSLLESQLKGLERNGLDETVLTPDDLINIRKMIVVLKSADNLPSSGLAAQSLVSSLLSTPMGSAGKVLHMGIIGKALTSKAASAILLGSGKKQVTHRSIADATRTLLEVQDELIKEQQ